MKSSNPIRIGIAVSVALVAAVIVFYWLTRNSAVDDYRKSIEDVQQIEQLAANWSVETARVRSDPLADFDSLTAFIPRMDALKGELLATVRGIADVPDRLVNDVSAYISAIEAKEERIERFKTGYAVIRNSSRYLPLAASNIVQAPGADAGISTEVAELTNEINAYLSSPTDAVKGRLAVALERLGESGATLAAPLPNHIANFIAHAEVLLAQQAPTAALFAQATSNEVSDLTAQLTNDLGFQLSKAQELNGYYITGMLAATGLLLILWILLAVNRVKAAAVPVSAGIQDAGATVASAAAAQPHAVADGSERRSPARPVADLESRSARQLMSHRIVANFVAERLTETANWIAENAGAPERDDAGAKTANAGAKQPEGETPADAGTTAVVGVRERAEEISRLAEQLASFAETGAGTGYGLVDVNDCIEEVVKTTDAGTVAAVSKDCGQVPDVFASRTEICLMLEKVIENSAQAIEDAGKDEGEITITTATENDKASITIIDNGIGMTKEERDRMFEPFFAGRNGRVGAGLLSTSYLVDKYEGTISVNSMPGGGTK